MIENKYVSEGGRYPMTPQDAARAIVDDLLSDLPLGRQQEVVDAIEAWGGEWGNLVSDSCQYDSYDR